MSVRSRRCALPSLLAVVLLAGACTPPRPAAPPDPGDLPIAGDPLEQDLGLLAPFQPQSRRTWPAHDPEVAVAVAISGGGLRATNFAVGVLAALAEYRTADGTRMDLLRECDYFSTVSGGSLAAGTYISELKRWRAGHGDAPYDLPRALRTGDLRTRLREDLEVGLWAGLVSPSIIFTAYDRGDALEELIDDVLCGHDLPDAAPWHPLRLGDMYLPRGAKRRPALPLLAANTTILTSSERLPLTPQTLAWLRVNTYVHRLDTVVHAGPRFYYDMPVSVAMKASASFPALIPTSNLRCWATGERRYLHLQDGGIVENIGHRTAFDLLRREDSARVARVLLVIDAYNHRREVHRLDARAGSPSTLGAFVTLQQAGLEHRHRNLQRELAMLGDLHDTAVVHLGFSDLTPPADGPRPELVPAVLDLVRTGVLRPDTPRAVLAELATQLYAIATRLTITATQQRLLLAAAAQIVRNRREAIDRELVTALRR